MRAQLCLGGDGVREAHERAVTRRRDAAGRNPRALKTGGFTSAPHFPLDTGDMPLWADITVSMVLSTEPTAIRVAGMGQSSEPYLFGDRPLRSIRSLSQAADRALTEAGTPGTAMDVAEVDGLTLIDEALGLEAVGLAPAGEGMLRLAQDPRANPSGGGASGYSRPTMGLLRIAEAILQLRGQAGPIQLDGVRTALASGSSTVAGQTQTVIVLEAA
jgi:acetyl-CoA C-acetyltransferase